MLSGILSLIVLISIHFFANQAKVLGWLWHGRFLSVAAGISFAYVFVDLLPSLEKGQPILKNAFGEIIPYFDRHAYLIALLGVLFYYGLQTPSSNNSSRSFWYKVSGYILFNFFVGTSLADSSNPDIQPLFLYTIAISMHYFIHDHNVSVDNEALYSHRIRILLIVALCFGYLVGIFTHIPAPVVVIAVSFLGGGMILNALRYELPKREQLGYTFFVIGALGYTALLLSVGIKAAT